MKYIRLISFISVDVLTFYSSIIVAFYIRKILNIFFSVKFNTPIWFYLGKHGFAFLIIFIFWMVLEGAYRQIYSFLEEFKSISKAIFLFFITSFAFVGITKTQNEYSRLMIGILSINLFLFSILYRKIFEQYFLKSFKNPAILVGFNQGAKEFFYKSKEFLAHIYDIECVFDKTDINKEIHLFNKNFHIKSLEYLKELNNKNYTVFVSSYIFEDFKEFAKLFTLIKNFSKEIILIEDYNKLTFVSSKMIAFPMTNHFLLSVKIGLNSKFNQILKTMIDYTMAILLLPILIILIIIFAILIKFDSKGSVFFTQERVGKDGKKFKIYKFRTMYEDAEKRLQDILSKDENMKKEWETYRKLKNDPRITKIGKFLRKTSLDELPQMINVLKGEMSIVGPRPAFEEELKNLYKEYAKLYMMVKPGITGFWQVSGRSEASFYERVLMEAFYTLNWSLWLDFYIILKTFKVVFKKEGAY